jgi:hypothetical protein
LFHRQGQGGHDPQVGGRSAAYPTTSAGGQGDAPAEDCGHGGLAPRGRGANAQPAQTGERHATADCGATPRGARPGRARSRGDNIGGLQRGGAKAAAGDRDQPRREHGEDATATIGHDVNASAMAVEGGKGKRKRTVECVICTDDHYTNQCPLLCGSKPLVAYCAASDDNVGFFHIQVANEQGIVSIDFSPAAALIKVEGTIWLYFKEDLLALFHEFHKESLDLFSLNFGIITLIPKIENATKIQQYRPICVLNVSFKIFAKVGTNRLNKVAKTVESQTQTAFMPGRNIMEGVVILHETIHELHTKKSNGENAYDKVKWSFIQQTLRMKGF